MTNQSATAKSRFLSMSVGETITFPLSCLTSIRALASTYGMESGYTFTTRSSREDGVVYVTRVS